MSLTNKIRAGGLTKRLHTWPTVRDQNVAAHSWGVAMLAREIYRRNAAEVSANLTIACLTHDVPEGVVGDVPSPVKWRNAALARELVNEESKVAEALHLHHEVVRLSVTEMAVLDFCDKLELLWHCVDERRLGNILIEVVFSRQLAWLEQNKLLRGTLFEATSFEMLEEVKYMFYNPAMLETPG